MVVCLHDLPPEVLDILFHMLDSRSLAVMTGVCTKFNEIVVSSDRLSRNLALYMRYPQDVCSFGDAMANSTRRYSTLKIVRSRDRDPDHQMNRKRGFQAFKQFARAIKHLTIDWSNAMRPREASIFEIMARRRGSFRGRGRAVPMDHLDEGIAAQALASIREDFYLEFVEMIQQFTGIQTLSLYNVHLERRRTTNEPRVQYSFLRQLVVNQCDSFCFDLLSTCNQLDSLTVADPWWTARNPGVDNFEEFLAVQKQLKRLDLKTFVYPRLFQTDRTRTITFKLKFLALKSVFFADKEIATSFFRSQNQLEEVDIQLHNEKIRCLDEMLWYNNIVKILFSSPNMKSISISKLRYKIDSYAFINGVINPHVQKLKFDVTSEDKSPELFKTCIKMFPNLKVVSFKAEENDDTDSGVCFDEGTVLERVESLIVFNSSVRSLVNVFASSLTSFEYVPGKTGEFIDDLFGGFFHRHRHIKHLVIGNNAERSYFFVSYNLCMLIVNFLTQLESITIYNFGEVNKSVKLLCNLPKLESLTLTEEDFQQFTAKTKVECFRNNLKLVPIKIPIPTSVTSVPTV